MFVKIRNRSAVSVKQILPNDVNTCLISADEMNPCPSLSNVLNASMKSA